MAIDLPDEVETFLNVIGIKWPSVNEDKVREFASHVREFAENLESAHADTTAAIQQLGEAYEGASYEALVATWASLSDTHMNELVRACHAVATALDAAADVIVAMKVEAMAELVVLAAASGTRSTARSRSTTSRQAPGRLRPRHGESAQGAGAGQEVCEMTWIIEGFRKGQDELTVWYRLPESFSVATAAEWVGDWPDLIGSVFDVPQERIPEMAALLGIEADPDIDYCLSDWKLG